MRVSLRLLGILSGVCLAAAIVRGEEAGASPAGPGPQVDPRAEKVLRAYAAAVGKAPVVKVLVHSTTTMTAEGFLQKMSTEYLLALKRPDKMALVKQKGMATGGDIVCDGKSLYSYFPPLNKYTVDPAPQKLSDIPQASEVWAATMGASMSGLAVAGGLLAEDVYAYLMEDVEKVEYVGKEKLDGVECHHLRFIQARLNADTWFEAGKPTLLRQVTPDLSRFAEQVREEMPGVGHVEMKMNVKMDHWQVGGDLPDDLFIFRPPAGAIKSDSLFADLRQGSSGESEMAGDKAPVFKLDLLEGGRVDLADHLGKDVIVLDFWATWCGPCVRALPEVAKVTAEYADRGVVFYAVNQGEKPQRIRDFLAKHGIECKVALDTDGAVGKLYGVRGIPRTVVIGRDGRIAKEHVGYAPGGGRRLAKELDELVAKQKK